MLDFHGKNASYKWMIGGGSLISGNLQIEKIWVTWSWQFFRVDISYTHDTHHQNGGFTPFLAPSGQTPHPRLAGQPLMDRFPTPPVQDVPAMSTVNDPN